MASKSVLCNTFKEIKKRKECFKVVLIKFIGCINENVFIERFKCVNVLHGCFKYDSKEFRNCFKGDPRKIYDFSIVLEQFLNEKSPWYVTHNDVYGP